jgi:hypothetical protein
MRKVRDNNLGVAYLSFEVSRLLVWPGQKVRQKAEFVHQFQRRRVDRVAAEVAQEVSVFLQNDDVYARPCEQEPQHHPRRTTARDAALHFTDRCIKK